MHQRQKLKKRIVQFRQWSNKRYGAFNSLRKVIKICTLAVAYTLVNKPVQVNGQTVDTVGAGKIYELDEITVQSTLIEQKNAETGRSVEVIKGAQIQNLPVNSIDELLKFIPGLEGKSRGAFGVQTDFSIRGSNFNQVLVLIDGVKINDPTTAHFNSNIPVSPSEIDRIEIIRGPASAEYGPDATGGIINIITKTFSQRNQQPLQADAKLQRGESNLYSTQAGFYYGSDQFRLGGGILFNKSDGQLLQTGLRNDFNVNTLSLSGRIQLNSNWSLALRTSRDYRDFAAQRFYTSLPSDSAHETVTRYGEQLQIQRKSDTYTTTISAGYLNTSDNYLFRPFSPASKNYTNLLNLKINQNISINNFTTFAAGISANQRAIESNNRGNHSLFHTGAFVGLLIKPVQPLSINSALRADYDQSYKFHLLPQLSLSYNIYNLLLLRAAGGASIRAADFTENYYNTEIKAPLSANQRLGNPYLKAEKSWSTEAGFDYNFIPGYLFSMTAFSRWSDNLIDYVLTPSKDIKNNGNLADANYLYAQNISNLHTYGLEWRFGLHRNLTNRIYTSLLAGFILQKSTNKDSILSLYISGQAKQLLTLDYSLAIGRFDFVINGLYKLRDTQFAKLLNVGLAQDYTVWNASMDIAVYKRNLLLTLSVENIFDENYSDILGAEMPRRWIMGGVKFKL